MNWVVTFLDLVLYLIFGGVVWRNAFPDYLHSESARIISRNGMDVVLLVNAHPYIQFFIRPPDCKFGILVKNQGDFFYDTLIYGYNYGRGDFGRDGCNEGHMVLPVVQPLRTSNNSKFVSVFVKEAYHYPRDRFALYPIVPSAKRDYVLSIDFDIQNPDSSKKTYDDDDELIKSFLDYRRKVKCGVIAKKGWYGGYAPEDTTRQLASDYFGDTAQANALYEVFQQLNFNTDCLDSLVRLYGKDKNN